MDAMTLYPNPRGYTFRLFCALSLLGALVPLGAGAQNPPIGVAAAGDSLWFLKPAEPESLHLRPAVPLPAEVYDLALQLNVRAPLFFEDARLVGGTSRGIFIWTPIAKDLYWNDLGRVEAVEASRGLWVLLSGERGTRRLRFAQTNRTEDLIDPEIWKVAAEDVPELLDLRLTALPGQWFKEIAPEEKAWEQVSGTPYLPVALACPRSGEELRMFTPSPNDHAASFAFTPPEGRATSAPAKRWVLPLQRVVAVFESDAEGRARVRFLGDGYTGEPIWESPEPLDAKAAAGLVPQGGMASWLVASDENLVLIQVPTPRRIRIHGETVTVEDRRKLPGTLSAMCTDGKKWTAVAYEEEEGRTTVEIVETLSWTLSTVAKCQIEGRIRALAFVPLQSFQQ
jgi:hypothetical protein